MVAQARFGGRVTAVFFIGVALNSGSAGAADKSRESEGARLAKAALAPYQSARLYKGTRTTTVKSTTTDSEVTRNVRLLVRADEHGTIERLSAATTVWGDRNGKDVTGQEDCEAVFDGTTLWTFFPKKARFRRSSVKLESLTTVLGLPPVGADWTVVPHRKDDIPDEKALRATVDDEQWTLVIDAPTGKLARIERLGGKGSKKWQSTTTLHDAALNKDEEIPQDKFVFVPPAGAVEETGPTAPSPTQVLSSEH